jgi:hypothetical protein
MQGDAFEFVLGILCSQRKAQTRSDRDRAAQDIRDVITALHTSGYIVVAKGRIDSALRCLAEVGFHVESSNPPKATS